MIFSNNFLLFQHEPEKYSSKFSDCAHSLCSALLAKSPASRLGGNAGKRGAAQVKAHRFFVRHNWARLEAGMVDAPFVPDVSVLSCIRNDLISSAWVLYAKHQ